MAETTLNIEFLTKELQKKLLEKTDLLESIATHVEDDKVKFTLVELKEIITVTLRTIEDVTIEHGELKLTEHGAFKSVRKEQRKGRNPKTGEEMLIPAKQVVTWKPAKAFKEKVAETIVTY